MKNALKHPSMSSETSERIIKRYSNRRLYDTAISRYITFEDVRKLVKEEIRFRIMDARSEEDLTRNILLQLILEQEEKGQAIFSTEMLQLFVRTYGETMQGLMAVYISESLEIFIKQQKLLQEQLANLIKTGPVLAFTELARHNLRFMQSVQDGIASAREEKPPGPEGEARKE